MVGTKGRRVARLIELGLTLVFDAPYYSRMRARRVASHFGDLLTERVKTFSSPGCLLRNPLEKATTSRLVL